MAVVTKEDEVFAPVFIALITQEEVDKMFSIFNFSPISKAVEWPEMYQQLYLYKTENYEHWHHKLDKGYKMR